MGDPNSTSSARGKKIGQRTEGRGVIKRQKTGKYIKKTMSAVLLASASLRQGKKMSRRGVTCLKNIIGSAFNERTPSRVDGNI